MIPKRKPDGEGTVAGDGREAEERVSYEVVERPLTHGNSKNSLDGLWAALMTTQTSGQAIAVDKTTSALHAALATRAARSNVWLRTKKNTEASCVAWLEAK